MPKFWKWMRVICLHLLQGEEEKYHPPPFIRLGIDVFDEETYGKIMDLAKELGPQHIILQTKQ